MIERDTELQITSEPAIAYSTGYAQFIFNEDNLITLKKTDNDEFDYVITSPPYNMGKDVSHFKKTSKYKSFDDNLTQEQYFEQQKTLLTELLRTTKNEIFYNIQMISNNKIALFKLIGHFAENIKEIIIWDKLNAEPAIQPGVLNSCYEFIIVLTKNKPENRKFYGVDFHGTIDNIFRNKKNLTKQDIEHSAIMPLNIVRKILLNFTKEGNIIYDPYMGFGTTAIGCILEKRKYVGSEICKYTYQKCIENVSNYQRQTRLF